MAIQPKKTWAESRRRVLAKHGIIEQPKPVKQNHDPELPPLWQQAINGAIGWWELVDSDKRVSKEIHDKRMAICKRCEHFGPHPLFGYGACDQCGCAMEAKTWLKKDHHGTCPLDKWGEGLPRKKGKCGGGCAGIAGKIKKVFKIAFHR